MTFAPSPHLSRPRAVASATAQAIDRAARGVAALGPGAFAWPFAIGVGVGVGLFGLRTPRFVDGVLKHKATLEFMRPALLAVFAATVVTLVVVLTLALVIRRRGGGSLGDAYVRTLRRGAFLTGLPLVVVLREPLEPSREWLILAFVAGTAALVTYSAYFSLPEPRVESRLFRKWTTKAAPARFVAWGVLGAALVLYAVQMARLSVANHFSFNTGRVDLGYYVSLLRESSEGRLLQCTLCGPGKRDFPHFEPILLLVAPVYRFFPFAETLLVLQTLWLASGAVAVFLLGEQLVRSRLVGVSLAVAYLAHPAVHGENLANFHSLTLAVPLFLWLLHCLERGAARAYLGVLVLLLLVREDVPLALSGVGLFAIFSGGSRERARLGLLTITVAVVWAIAVVALGGPSPFRVLTALATSPDGAQLRGHLRTLNPGVLAEGPLLGVSRALALEKMDYASKLLVPLLGVPLLARGRILLAYGGALSLLAVAPDVASLHFEHSSLLVPFLFVLTAAGLQRLGSDARPLGFVSGKRLARALSLGIALASLLASTKLGATVENGSFRAGSRPLVRAVKPENLVPNAWLRKISRSLPKGAKVAATSRLLPHLGAVSHLYGIADRSQADYVVANMKQRALAKELGSEESRGYLAHLDGTGDLRLYRAQYRGFAPPPTKRLDDE